MITIDVVVRVWVAVASCCSVYLRLMFDMAGAVAGALLQLVLARSA